MSGIDNTGRVRGKIRQLMIRGASAYFFDEHRVEKMLDPGTWAKSASYGACDATALRPFV